MSKFLLVPDDRMFDTNSQAAEAVLPAWNSALLAKALSALQPGDELEIDDAQSFIRLSEKCTRYLSG